MQAVPARYVSVSELYSADEVELLLDEIRELEPTSCRGEDVQPSTDWSIRCGMVVQDFEIAGSGCGACGGGGGRSPAGTEATERSWDSHAQYLREPPLPPQPLAPLYCRPRYLLQLQGFCSLLVAVCSVCVCGCVWAGAGARLGGGGAGAGAVRALQLGAITSLLLHAALLTVRLTALHLLMPIDWDALSALCCLWSACWLGGGATALAVQMPPAPHRVRDLFHAAIGLALVAALAGAVVSGVWSRARLRAARARAVARGAYRAVPGGAPSDPGPACPDTPPALPSTSRHAPL